MISFRRWPLLNKSEQVSAENKSCVFTLNFVLISAAATKYKISIDIAFLQNHTLIVHPSCTNFVHELENFSYIKSKQTGEFTNDTTHEFSHAIDACRYAYSDIYTNRQLKSISKAALSL